MANEFRSESEGTGRGADLWKRGLFMLLFALIWGVAEIVVLAVALVQFGWVVATGAPNDLLTRFGGSLARFYEAITRFVTFHGEAKPFPFADWPESGPADPYP
jgi:hypothetical protein